MNRKTTIITSLGFSRGFHAAVIFTLLFFLFTSSACQKKREKQILEADSLYQKGQMHWAGYEYASALESFHKSYALDTALGRLPQARRTLLSLYDVHERSGNLSEALSLLDVLAKQSVNADSVRFFKKKRVDIFYRSGNTLATLEELRALGNPSPSDELLLGKLHLALGYVDEAQSHFLLAKSAPNPVTAMSACAELAGLFQDYRITTRLKDSSDVFLEELVSIARTASESQKSPRERFEIAFRAALVLAEFSSTTSEARFFFRQAENAVRSSEWNSISRPAYLAMVSLGMASLDTLRSGTLEAAFNTLQKKNNELGKAYASMLMGLCRDYDTDRQIGFLKRGLDGYDDLLYTAPAFKLVMDMDEGCNALIQKLGDDARRLEAFEVSERVRMLRQKKTARIYMPTLPDSVLTSLFRRSLDQMREITFLTMTNDSLAFSENDTLRESAQLFTKERIGIKRGEFYETVSLLKNASANLAAWVSPDALTLSDVQNELPFGEALLDIVPNDSTTSLILVTRSSIEQFTAPISKPDLRRAVRALRYDLLNGIDLSATDVLKNETRQMLSTALLTPLMKKLVSLTKLYVITQEPLPIHLLGETPLQERIQISRLTSALQLRLGKSLALKKSPDFVSDDELDIIHTRYFFEERESLLPLRPLSAEQSADYKQAVTEAYQKNKTLAQFLKDRAAARAAKGDYSWIYVTCYGR
jgi:tetratricopeptide (TPR) repeat protein